MHTSQKNKSINMTSDPAESDDECGGSGGYDRGDGSLSIARLGAPLPLLVSHPGRQPHLPTQEVREPIVIVLGVKAGGERNRGVYSESFATAVRTAYPCSTTANYPLEIHPYLHPITLCFISHLSAPQFSVSFPSGIRRTSSLTTSITPCLGPPPPTVPATTKTTNFGETDQSDGRGGHREIENSRAMRSVRPPGSFRCRWRGVFTLYFVLLHNKMRTLPMLQHKHLTPPCRLPFNVVAVPIEKIILGKFHKCVPCTRYEFKTEG